MAIIKNPLIVSGGVTPTGNINITTMNSTDVTNYATAQVVDADLVAGNIKKDVDILGVVGSYEGGGGSQPTLNAPTISLSTHTLTITNPSTNGNFVAGYKIYADGTQWGSAVSCTTYPATADLSGLTDNTNAITVKFYGTNFTDSAASNSVTHYKYYTVTFYDGSTVMQTGLVQHGTTISACQPSTEKTGYTFKGWFEESTFETEISASTSVVSDMTLYGKFTALAFYNVSFTAMDSRYVHDIAFSPDGTKMAVLNTSIPKAVEEADTSSTAYQFVLEYNTSTMRLVAGYVQTNSSGSSHLPTQVFYNALGHLCAVTTKTIGTDSAACFIDLTAHSGEWMWGGVPSESRFIEVPISPTTNTHNSGVLSNGDFFAAARTGNTNSFEIYRFENDTAIEKAAISIYGNGYDSLKALCPNGNDIVAFCSYTSGASNYHAIRYIAYDEVNDTYSISWSTGANSNVKIPASAQYSYKHQIIDNGTSLIYSTGEYISSINKSTMAVTNTSSTNLLTQDYARRFVLSTATDGTISLVSSNDGITVVSPTITTQPTELLRYATISNDGKVIALSRYVSGLGSTSMTTGGIMIYKYD